MKLSFVALTAFALSTSIIDSDLLYAAEVNVDAAPFGMSREQNAPLLRWGPVIIHPFLSLQETYSDNIYLTSDNKQHDFITTVMPGVQFNLPFSRHQAYLFGSGTFINYAKYTAENTADWNVGAGGDFNFGSRINLKASDSYLDGHKPRSESALGEVERFNNNNASASLSYVLGDISKLRLDYANADWKFKTNLFESRNENTLSAYAYYRFLPKTSAFVEYEFKTVYFTDKTVGNYDNNAHSGLIGVTWKLSDYSQGTIKGGYQRKDFNDPSQVGFSGFVASLDLAHRFSDYDSVKFTGARTINETSLVGTSYSISTGLNGEYTHKFNDRLSTSIKASFSNEEFSAIATGDSVKRTDQVVMAGANVRYLFRRWLESTLEYYWRQKNSNIDVYDSTENNVSMALKAFF